MGIDTLRYILRPDSGFLRVNLGLFCRSGAFLILPLPTAGFAAEIGLVALVFQFFFLPNGLLFFRGQLHFSERRRDVLANKIEVNLHRLGGFDTALAVTLMDKDFDSNSLSMVVVMVSKSLYLSIRAINFSADFLPWS